MSLSKIDEIFKTVPKSPLFHYTNAAGFIGILEHKTIWASSAYHLNDTQEFQYAIDLICDTLRAATKGAVGASGAVYGELLDELQKSRGQLQIYVASFSQEPDLLSQWLAYGPGSNAYSIGFRRAHFREAFRKGFRLLKCIYEESEHVALVRSIIDAFAKDGPFGNDDAVQAALTAAAAIKHPGFKQESEWRLVSRSGTGWTADAATKFRHGRNGIVPYLEVPLLQQRGQFRPHSVVLGPNDDIEVAEYAMETFLGARDMRHLLFSKGPKVLRSRTPYRP